MDNRDFWRYIRVAKLPEFVPLLNESRVENRPSNFWTRLKIFLNKFRRFCYKHFHDLVFSSIFGFLTLNEQLYIAVHENNLFKAKKLLFWGGRPSFIPSDVQRILANFIRDPRQKKDFHIDRSLINSILAMDSMLYMAVSYNNLSLVKEMISYHDYKATNEHNEVVSLCLAVERGEIDLVRILIEHGHIDPNDQVFPNCKHCKTTLNANQRFKFPLYHACRRNHWNLVKYLIETKKCSVNQLSSTFETSLHGAILGAIENPSDSDVKKYQRYRIVEYLLAQPQCDPNLGVNPLCISLLHDNFIDYTGLLLNNGCDVDRLGWNISDVSINIEHKSNCQIPFLLDHPLNICLRQISNLTKDSIASNFHALRRNALMMIERRANIYAMSDYDSPYPFLLTVRTGDKTLVKHIAEHCRDYIRFELCEPLIQATTRSQNEIVKILLDVGFRPNQVQPDFYFQNVKHVSLDRLTRSEFLNYLNRYCSQKVDLSIKSKSSDENRPTAFSALMKMPSWIFHSDQYLKTIETLRALASVEKIDFQINSNRFAFCEALINGYYPFVYYCLENKSPIDFNDQPIEFRRFRSQNQFSFTLFNLVSLCSRLTSKKKIQIVLFDAFESFINRFSTGPQQPMKKYISYLNLWLNDEDFSEDSVLFEHLLNFSSLNGIFNENLQNIQINGKLRKFIEDGTTREKCLTLKQISRKIIRKQTQIFADKKRQNLLIMVDAFNDFLPKSLIQYLFYSQDKSKSLINCLIDKQSWDSIQWV